MEQFEIQMLDEEAQSSFAKIGNVKANNLANSSYEFKHQLLLNKPLYYRLKMIDSDGTYSYSKIIVAENYAVNKTFYLKNNIVESEIEFIKNDAPLDIEIYDLGGKCVKKVKLSTLENKILFNDVVKGIFLLRDATGETVFKIIKL